MSKTQRGVSIFLPGRKQGEGQLRSGVLAHAQPHPPENSGFSAARVVSKPCFPMKNAITSAATESAHHNDGAIINTKLPLSKTPDNLIHASEHAASISMAALFIACANFSLDVHSQNINDRLTIAITVPGTVVAGCEPDFNCRHEAIEVVMASTKKSVPMPRVAFRSRAIAIPDPRLASLRNLHRMSKADPTSINESTPNPARATESSLTPKPIDTAPSSKL